MPMNKKYSDTLFLITARGGSKGLPGKNIRPLDGKPLISYSIEFARNFVPDARICLSTDDKEIIRVAENDGLSVPFVRPEALATDNAGSYGVIQHALEFYSEAGIQFQYLVLLQPTSPLRKKEDLEQMFDLIGDKVDAVVSVKEADENPLFNLYTESEDGKLRKFYDKDVQQRQSTQRFYSLNGSIYLLNVKSISEYPSIPHMPGKRKYVMDSYYSIDIDNKMDFDWCEYVVKNKLHLP